MVPKRKKRGLQTNFSYLASLLMLKTSSLTRKDKLLMDNSSEYSRTLMQSLIKKLSTESELSVMLGTRYSEMNVSWILSQKWEMDSKQTSKQMNSTAPFHAR